MVHVEVFSLSKSQALSLNLSIFVCKPQPARNLAKTKRCGLSSNNWCLCSWLSRAYKYIHSWSIVGVLLLNTPPVWILNHSLAYPLPNTVEDTQDTLRAQRRECHTGINMLLTVSRQIGFIWSEWRQKGARGHRSLQRDLPATSQFSRCNASPVLQCRLKSF